MRPRKTFCDIQKNQVTSFIGPSGCGKSTVIRAINRMNDLIEELSKVDMDLVKKVIHHLNDDDLEGRDSKNQSV